MSSSHLLTVAVVMTACSRSRRITVRLRALCLVAVNPAAHTLTLFTHTHGIEKNLSVHKQTVFKGAIWKRCKYKKSFTERTETSGSSEMLPFSTNRELGSIQDYLNFGAVKRTGQRFPPGLSRTFVIMDKSKKKFTFKKI